MQLSPLGSEFWVISHDMKSNINTLATSCYRIMLNIKRKDHVPNTMIYTMTNIEPLIHHVGNRQLRFLGYILHIPEEEPASRVFLKYGGHKMRGYVSVWVMNCADKWFITLKHHSLFVPAIHAHLLLAYIQYLLGYKEGSIQADQIAMLAKDWSAWRSLVVGDNRPKFYLQNLFQNFWNSNFQCHMWLQHEKCIQMSTNKPSIGSGFLEIVL